MKKNMMMRIASAAFVATMLTTCIVGGTYAKYVSVENGHDTARVAKFGIVTTVSGDLFGTSYAAVADGNSIQSWSVNKETVASDKTDADKPESKVVAPGTKNNTGMTISVKGKPEVSTKITYADATATVNDSTVLDNRDIFLKNGKYTVMTPYTGVVNDDNITTLFKLNDNNQFVQASVGDTGTLYKDAAGAVFADAEATYYPIQWKVNDGTNTTDCANVAAVQTALAIAGTNAPNEAIDKTYKVTWEWAFEDADSANVDKTDRKDTILGDMIACDTTTAKLGDSYVVLNDGSTLKMVRYKELTDGTKVAYTGDTVPTAVDADNVVACLTVRFGARITVTQVD